MARKKRSIPYWLFLRIPFWAAVLSLLVVTVLKWTPVTRTPLMYLRERQNKEIKSYHTEQYYVPIDQVSPEMIRAVLAGEDIYFFEHHGFAWRELRKMYRQYRRNVGELRGCSTVSQQTAKNVFTFGTGTWIRKLPETWWTFFIELVWGKEKILEVYLNVAELGKGVFGVEAAARRYYGKHAAEIQDKEAASIAACLPFPLRESPKDLSEEGKKRRAKILRMARNIHLEPYLETGRK